MATSFENNESSLSEVFNEQLNMFQNIENSDLPTSSDELQNKILASIKSLEELTVSVSYLGLFSSNETYEEIPGSSIKFLLLPFLLGTLSLKLSKSDRIEVIQMANVYFKDFLRRCTMYELADYKDPAEQEEEIQSRKIESVNVPRRDFPKLAKQREEKLACYRKKKALSDKLNELKKYIDKPDPEEQTLRDYYLTMIKQFVCQSYDELDSISLELTMLERVKEMNIDQEEKSSHKIEKSKPLKPFLITKDAIQKEVFGMGYPSLPIMSVEEFYEQRVKDGWFPSMARFQREEAKLPLQSEDKVEEDAEEDIEKLRQRDEWRDTHRRGWGNTYNKG